MSRLGVLPSMAERCCEPRAPRLTLCVVQASEREDEEEWQRSVSSGKDASDRLGVVPRTAVPTASGVGARESTAGEAPLW